jgi:hypothetical protein
VAIISSLSEKFDQKAHIFYCFEDLERYLENAIYFRTSGIQKGEQVIFIENEKIFSKLFKELSKILTKKQLAKVQFINNFDYYCSGGRLHPPTTLDYYSKAVEPYYKKDIPFRIWGHVEWDQQENILSTLETFENKMSAKLSKEEILAVCAYDAERVTDGLMHMLIACHDLLLTDRELTSFESDRNR